MKLLFKIPFTIFLFAILLSFSACNDNSGKDCFKTKQDSLAFAKTVFMLYPIEKNVPLIVTFSERTAAAPSEPVPWDTIDRYKSQYDANPLLQKPGPGGAYYKGFILDAASFTAFKSNADCAQLYLRFGTKDNGEYTIMVLPMDKSKNLLQ
ncbi:MAG: hypothetical protein ABIN74_06130, partial [Ferruginibacter sp.]